MRDKLWCLVCPAKEQYIYREVWRGNFRYIQHLLELAFPCIESLMMLFCSHQVLRHLSEAGLTRKWVDDRMDAVAKLSKTHRRSEVNPLTPRHLQARMH